MDEDALDFAVVVWREGDAWQVENLQPRSAEALDRLVAALRGQPGEGGSFALVSVAEEFFLAVRVLGDDVRLLLSDVEAAADWPLGREALGRLGIELPDDEDDDLLAPAGDLRIFDDFGVGPDEVDVLCSDPDLYPDEMLASVASRIGFGDQFDAALESLPD